MHMSKSPVPIIQALVRLFDDQGNLVGDFNQIQNAVNDAYATLSAYSLARPDAPPDETPIGKTILSKAEMRRLVRGISREEVLADWFRQRASEYE
jgi:hypothetical protein